MPRLEVLGMVNCLHWGHWIEVLFGLSLHREHVVTVVLILLPYEIILDTLKVRNNARRGTGRRPHATCSVGDCRAINLY